MQNVSQFQQDLQELGGAEGVDRRAFVIRRFFAQEGLLSTLEASKNDIFRAKAGVAEVLKPKADRAYFTLDDEESEVSSIEGFDESPLAESLDALRDHSSLRSDERKAHVDRGLEWIDLNRPGRSLRFIQSILLNGIKLSDLESQFF